ncbi:universal stress protein [Nonomuraea wenchangensis]|uniref:universal stress protein n=1 Tax=Nonomuraea wenchangensis TaxID=568860 RepID=UPI00342D011B
MNDGQAGRPVLVGYDESAASRHALNWAVEEARLRRAPVLVCHALHWPYTTKPVSAEMMAQIEQVAQGVVDEGVRRARELAPEVDARGLLARGTPAAVLLEAGREAELTVLGSRGQGGFDDLRVGRRPSRCPHIASPRSSSYARNSGHPPPPMPSGSWSAWTDRPLASRPWSSPWTRPRCASAP